MDEMRIESKFGTAIASRVVKMVLRNNFMVNADVRLNKFRTVIMDDEKTHLHLDVDLELTKEELEKLLKNIGL